jgi:hypothetical protein
MSTSRDVEQRFRSFRAIAVNASGRPVALSYWPSGLTEEPPSGAHLATPRNRYTHHGIYIGDGNVIHYAGFSRSLHAGPVEEVDVIEFAFGHPLHIVDHPQARYSAQQIVQRARSRLGERAFDLLNNNCEHFCNWCISGHHRSEQVERFGTLAFLILHRAPWPKDRVTA